MELTYATIVKNQAHVIFLLGFSCARISQVLFVEFVSRKKRGINFF